VRMDRVSMMQQKIGMYDSKIAAMCKLSGGTLVYSMTKASMLQHKLLWRLS
jgi:hypothetical protein